MCLLVQHRAHLLDQILGSAPADVLSNQRRFSVSISKPARPKSARPHHGKGRTNCLKASTGSKNELSHLHIQLASHFKDVRKIVQSLTRRRAAVDPHRLQHRTRHPLNAANLHTEQL